MLLIVNGHSRSSATQREKLIDRVYKARLVEKGFSHKYGEDYDATFATVAKQSTFRTLLAIAAKTKLRVRH